MSLILEALKKAEQDRQAGQAPPLDELLARPPTIRQVARRREPQRETLLIAAVAAALLFGVAGLVYWFWPTAPSSPPSEPAQAAGVAAAEVATADDAPAEPVAPLRVDPERLAPPIADAPEQGLDLSDTGASEAGTLDELGADEPVAAPPPASKPAQRPAPAPQAASVPPPPPDAAPAEPAAVEPPVAAAPQPPPEPSVKPLKEMPASYRSEFPRLAVDVHVYDRNPLRRFVLINGKKYRETDTLIDGPRVLEITPFGVIVEHRNSKVLLELPR